MSVFHKINSNKNNVGHFVIIAVILLVGFGATVYFLKHPVVKSETATPIVISDKSTTTAKDTDKATTSSESNPSQNSTNSNIPQTGLPVTGPKDVTLQIISVFILGFVVSKYLLSRVNLTRYF